MKRFMCFVLMLILVTVHSGFIGRNETLAEGYYGEVYLTGDVNVRDIPDLSGNKLTTLKSGSVVGFAGAQETDGRGVVWYKIILSDGETGWVSSKYAELDENAVLSDGASGDDLNTKVERIPAGVVYSRSQIEEWYGIFNYNDLINVEYVEAYSDGAMQTLDVHFKEDVFWGGTDGYAEYWLVSDGILTEGLVDIDSDGAQELIVVYLDSVGYHEYDYYYVENEYSIAVFEPADGGYVFADDMTISVGNMSERFVRYLEAPDANYIMTGYIAYWDGGSGGMGAQLYGYDGDSFYIAAVIEASTDGSYCLSGEFEPYKLKEIQSLCGDYDFYPEEAHSMGICEGDNFMYIDGTYNIFDNETGELNVDSLNGVETVSAAASAYGLDMGYYIEGGEYSSYRLYMNGGADLLWADEIYDGGYGCVRMKLFGYLDYSGNNEASGN